MDVKILEIKRYQDIILDKIHQRGWNAYLSTDSQVIGADEVLSRGTVSRLEADKRYILMPRIEEHNNSEAVFDALERVSVEQLNRQTPTISINGSRFPWTGFIPRKADVKVNTAVGHYIGYQDFIDSLDSITQVRI